MVILAGLQGVVRSFAIPGGILVDRRDTSTVDASGNPQHGSVSTFRADPAVVQPARGRDLLRLPEGDRTAEAVIVHTLCKLQASREGSGIEADVVRYRAGGEDAERRYVVFEAADWTIEGGFYRSVAIREESDG